MLSSDRSTIYSFFAYAIPLYLYFAGFSATRGSVTTTRYKSSISVSDVRGSALNGDYMVAQAIKQTKFHNSVIFFILTQFGKKFKGLEILERKKIKFSFHSNLIDFDF